MHFRQNDFTIEWYQYKYFPYGYSDLNGYRTPETPYMFSIGNSQDPTNANDTFYVKVMLDEPNHNIQYKRPNSMDVLSFPTRTRDYLNWTHYAISRKNDMLYVYDNGVSIANTTDPITNQITPGILDTTEYIFQSGLRIGSNQFSTSTNALDPDSYNGAIFYISIVNGTSLFHTDSTVRVPTTLPDVSDNTCLLLTSTKSLGTLADTISKHNIGIDPIWPPGFGDTVVVPPYQNNVIATQPTAYTDNTLVFYKPHSLGYGGVRTIANSRIIARRT